MKNYEKYAEEIRKYEGTSFCDDFIIPHIFNSEGNCRGIDCNPCHMLQMRHPCLEGHFVHVGSFGGEGGTQIVVALLGDEATVKRLKRQNGEVWLMPENPAYAPIDIGGEDETRNVRILGRAVAVRFAL